MPLIHGCSRSAIGANIEEMSKHHSHKQAVAAALNEARRSCPTTYARTHPAPHHSDPPSHQSSHHSPPITRRTGEGPVSSYPRMPVSTEPYSTRRRAPSRGIWPYQRHRVESGTRSYRTVFGPSESVSPSFGDREIRFQEYAKLVGRSLVRQGVRPRAAEQLLDTYWEHLRSAFIAFESGENVTYSPHRVATAILNDDFHGA